MKGVPLKPATAEELHKLYLARGARATTAIEGNTLTEEEVSRLVDGNLELPPSKEYLGREVENIINACNSILNWIEAGSRPAITPERIKALNRQVLDGLSLDEGVVPGETRMHAVGVGRYRGAPAQDCEHLLARLCNWLENGEDWDNIAELGLAVPLLKALVAHIYLAWIHPFGDGNGRTARLIEYQILVSSGFPSPAGHLLSNHYNETRSEYYRQLDKSINVPDDPSGFFLYALRGFVDGLLNQMSFVRKQQLDVAWENYVHDKFRDRNQAAATRRRHLVFDLPDQTPVKRSEIRELSPRLAAEYAGKTGKTISRDINALETMGLIRRAPQGIVKNQEAILAFLPLAATPTEGVGGESDDGQLSLF